MIELIPPLGTPIRIKDVFLSLRSMHKHSREEFEEYFSNFIGSKDSFLLDSGRNAFLIILKVLKDLSSRKDVILPAYTCPTMAYAVKRAGLNLKLCDVNPGSLSLDLDSLSRLVNNKTLCVVPTHLFGFPCSNLEKIIQISRRQGAFVIEDTAQAAGASLNSKMLGSFGDMAVFSLGKGKNFTTIYGGIITTNSLEYTQRVKKYLKDLPKPNLYCCYEVFFELIMYSILIRPLGFGLITKIINPENVEYSYFVKPRLLSDFQASIGLALLKNLNQLNQTRRKNGQDLYWELKGLSGCCSVIKQEEQSVAAYPSFPVIIKDKSKCDIICKRLKQSGIGAARMYPVSLNKIWNSSDHCPNAEFISERLLILPTNPFMNQKYITAVGKILRTAIKPMIYD